MLAVACHYECTRIHFRSSEMSHSVMSLMASRYWSWIFLPEQPNKHANAVPRCSRRLPRRSSRKAETRLADSRQRCFCDYKLRWNSGLQGASLRQSRPEFFLPSVASKRRQNLRRSVDFLRHSLCVAADLWRKIQAATCSSRLATASSCRLRPSLSTAGSVRRCHQRRPWHGRGLPLSERVLAKCNFWSIFIATLLTSNCF